MPELAHRPHNCPQLTVKSGPAPLCLIQRLAGISHYMLHPLLHLGKDSPDSLFGCIREHFEGYTEIWLEALLRDDVTQENHMISGEMVTRQDQDFHGHEMLRMASGPHQVMGIPCPVSGPAVAHGRLATGIHIHHKCNNMGSSLMKESHAIRLFFPLIFWSAIGSLFLRNVTQGLQGVATRVHAGVLSPQSVQDSGLSLVQEEGLPKSAYAFVGSDETSGVLKRRKREWTIPQIKISENERGPFPVQFAKFRSDEHEDDIVVYNITGPGADQPPINLFIINELGRLYVTQPLDREKQARYTLYVHVVFAGGGQAEDPVEIDIRVIDQNDNEPVFKQNPFLRSVPEASKIGFEFMNVVATDADEPGHANSEIRYKIKSQHPPQPNENMFSINPVTGAIQVNGVNLDREKIHEYILEIQAADLEGEGLTAYSKAIITITDSNDHAPQLNQTHRLRDVQTPSVFINSEEANGRLVSSSQQ
ncbi:cadherin-4-like [Clupea harengus]|uniref:Cadherin-4-like n=1 Tax=Clupea harengus TaxID=7950 RepID=A0A8M1KIL2_CLUHA|nr:cadherin-4-like [Clupea harengus]